MAFLQRTALCSSLLLLLFISRAHAAAIFGYPFTPVGSTDVTQVSATEYQITVNSGTGNDGIELNIGSAVSSTISIAATQTDPYALETEFTTPGGGTINMISSMENPLSKATEWVGSKVSGEKATDTSVRMTLYRDNVAVFTEEFPAGWNTAMVEYPLGIAVRHGAVAYDTDADGTPHGPLQELQLPGTQLLVAHRASGTTSDIDADLVRFETVGTPSSGTVLSRRWQRAGIGHTLNVKNVSAAPTHKFECSGAGNVSLSCDATGADGDGALVVLVGAGGASDAINIRPNAPGVAFTLTGSGPLLPIGETMGVSGVRVDNLQLAPLTFVGAPNGMIDVGLNAAAISDIGDVVVEATRNGRIVASVALAKPPDILATHIDTASGVTIGYQVAEKGHAKITTPFAAQDALVVLEFAASNIQLQGTGNTVAADRIVVRCPNGACRGKMRIPPAIKGIAIERVFVGHSIVSAQVYEQGDYTTDLGLNPSTGGTFEIGDNVCFEVPLPHAALTAPWHKDGVPFPGATDDRLCLSNLQLDDSGTYSITYDDGSKSVVTYSVTINVVPNLSANSVVALSIAMLAIIATAMAAFRVSEPVMVKVKRADP